MLYSEINLYSTVCVYFHYNEKYNCCAGVSMTLPLACLHSLIFFFHLKS